MNFILKQDRIYRPHSWEGSNHLLMSEQRETLNQFSHMTVLVITCGLFSLTCMKSPPSDDKRMWLYHEEFLVHLHNHRLKSKQTCSKENSLTRENVGFNPLFFVWHLNFDSPKNGGFMKVNPGVV